MKNPLGDLFRALGLALILMIKRSESFTARYKILPQLSPFLRLNSRLPFPPRTDNPWQYQAIDEISDPPFAMIKTLIVLGILGTMFGWQLAKVIYILPTWLVGFISGTTSIYGGTLRDPNGDLLRVIGMKIVALTGLLIEINEELLISPKLGEVCHISFSQIAALDRKYQIRRRILDFIGYFMETLSAKYEKMKNDMGNSEGGRSNTMSQDSSYFDPINLGNIKDAF